MSTTNDLIGLQNLLIDELPTNVELVLLAARWRGAIERDISALGADYELVAGGDAGGKDLLDRSTDGAFRTLAPVVDRRVEQIHARTDRELHRGFIRGVVSVGVVAEVRADANRRNRRTERRRPKEVVGELLLRIASEISRYRPPWREARSCRCRSVKTVRLVVALAWTHQVIRERCRHRK